MIETVFVVTIETPDQNPWMNVQNVDIVLHQNRERSEQYGKEMAEFLYENADADYVDAMIKRLSTLYYGE